MSNFHPLTTWTEEQDAELRLLWDEGRSASKIARTGRCGDRSRNAIIGRAHRLQLTARAPRPVSDACYTPRIVREPRVKAERPAKPEAEPRYASGSWGCLWIEADHDLANAPKCGERRIHKNGRDSSYCAAHHARAFTAAYRISDEERERRRDLGRRNIARWNARARA